MLYASAVIDFDHNATTPLDPRVRAAMIECVKAAFERARELARESAE